MSKNYELKRLLLILLGISLLFIAKFVSAFVLNEVVIDYYHERVYSDTLVKGLYIFNITEREVVYYNHGNLLYKEEKYEEAKEKYEKALSLVNKKNPHLCPIVNNYALTLTQLIDVETDEEKIAALEAIKEELYKYDCAGEGESNGNDSSSDQLEQEINKAIEEIENGDQTPTTPQQDKKDKELESQLEEQEKDSRSQRNDELEQQEEPSNWDGITW